MRKNIISGLIGLGLVTLASPMASALLKDYQIGAGSSVSANSSDPGLVINTSVLGSFANSAFQLDDGQSRTLNFFNIWTTEGAVNSDDRAPQAISATINFSNPITSGTVNGSTVGSTFGIAGFYQEGRVSWNGPTTITLADRTFRISLSDEDFNEGIFWGLGNHGARVQATVRQITSSRTGGGSSVPDSGTTLSLLGLGLIGLFAARKRARK